MAGLKPKPKFTVGANQNCRAPEATLALTLSQNRRSVRAKHPWSNLYCIFPLTVKFGFAKVTPGRPVSIISGLLIKQKTAARYCAGDYMLKVFGVRGFVLARLHISKRSDLRGFGGFVHQ